MSKSKRKWIVVGFSGGKDSTAMVLHQIEIGEHIDEVLHCDIGKEFPEMYRHIDKVRKVVEEAGIKFTTLRSEKSFDHLMFEEETTSNRTGRGWATFKIRWCTGELKKDITRKYLNNLKKQYDIVQCVGIAADEEYRLERKNNQDSSHRHPLVEWGWDEKTCLKYCYDRGYDWEGLYELFDRVSCWCCPLKNLDELRKLWKHFPNLWEELKNMDQKAWNQFRADYSVQALEKRFTLEEKRMSQGLSITSREFHRELKNVLNTETSRQQEGRG